MRNGQDLFYGFQDLLDFAFIHRNFFDSRKQQKKVNRYDTRGTKVPCFEYSSMEVAPHYLPCNFDSIFKFERQVEESACLPTAYII
jgi:hypothetical protein